MYNTAEILWQDSHGVYAWQDTEEALDFLEKKEPILSCGLLIKEDKDSIYIALSVSGDNVLNLLRIPRACILEEYYGLSRPSQEADYMDCGHIFGQEDGRCCGSTGGMRPPESHICYPNLCDPCRMEQCNRCESCWIREPPDYE